MIDVDPAMVGEIVEKVVEHIGHPAPDREDRSSDFVRQVLIPAQLPYQEQSDDRDDDRDDDR